MRFDMPKKKTQEQFIADVENKYGKDVFDLSKVIYVNSTTKITVGCKEHGDFSVQPNNFLYGKGCPSCAKNNMARKLQTPRENLIERVREVHGQSFTLLTEDFNNQHEVVLWECKVHGEFRASIRNILSGSGCKFCSRERSAKLRSKGADYYIPLFREIHGDFFDYTKSVFSTSKSKIIVTCPVHGDFETSVGNHLKGKACRRCAVDKFVKERSLTLPEIKVRLKDLHKDSLSFPYIDLEFKNKHSLITCVCEKHGVFEKKVKNLLWKPSGCNKCGGIDRSLPTYLYIKFLGSKHLKVGITNNLNIRSCSLRNATALPVKDYMDILLPSGFVAIELEKQLLSLCEFGILNKEVISQGFTETTHITNLDLILDHILDFFTNNTSQ